jgi:SAM-dependent methyltransferase
MKESKLTGQTFWEDYWEGKPGTGVQKKTTLLIREILKTFDKYLPAKEGLSILEVGGAYGEYLLYLTRRFGYKAFSLDYSRVGNEQTLETFSKAGLPVEVFERDLFSDNHDLPKFDIVYSLGFIEHFDDPDKVVAKHLDLLKPGGILLLGVPNYAGVYQPVLRRLAPSIEQTHNMNIMNIDNWKAFEIKLSLQPVFKGYIGGFEPLNMKKMEVKTPLNQVIYFFTRVLMVLFSFRMQFLRKFNSKHWSGYLMGIYRKPVS